MNKYDRPLATLDNNVLLGYFKDESGALDCSPKNIADAEAMRQLLKLQCGGAIRLMIGLSTALEQQPSGEKLDLHAYAAQLEARGIDREDIFTCPRTIAFVTSDAPDAMTFDMHLDLQLNQAIHAILFEGKTEPNARNVDFSWAAFRERDCVRHGIEGIDRQALAELDDIRINRVIPPSPFTPVGRRTPALDALSPERTEELSAVLATMADDWMNRKNDALGLYNHLTHALHTTVPQQAVFVTSDKNFKRYSQVLKKSNLERLRALGYPGHIMKPGEAVSYFQKVTSAGLPQTA
jgi:hypothetical protein